MKRHLARTLLTAAVSMTMIASCVYAAPEAEQGSDGVSVYINGNSIRSYYADGQNYIIADDLGSYGFLVEETDDSVSVSWAGTDYYYDDDTLPATIADEDAVEIQEAGTGSVAGEETAVYDINGQKCIAADSLAAFGYTESSEDGSILNIYAADAGYGESENAYRTVTVDASGTGTEIKNLLGTHWDPGTEGSDRSNMYIELGISNVRTHQSGSWEPDYTDPETGETSNDQLSIISEENKGRGDVYGIFKDADADPDDWASYDFASTDKLIDDILAIGATVTFRFSGINEPCPDDEEEFQAYCEKYAKVAAHIVDHYNNGADGSKYQDAITFFEIWNEPDIQGGWAGRDSESGEKTGNAEQFCTFYGAVTAAAKETDPDLVVGGYAFTTHDDVNGYGETLINSIVENGYVMDRFSFHYYPSVNKDVLSYTTLAQMYTDIFNEVAEKYNKPEYANMPLAITEWDYLETTGFTELTEEERPGEKMAAYVVNALTYMQDTALVEADMWTPTYNDARLYDNDNNITTKGSAYQAMNVLADTERLAATGGDKNGFSVLAGKDDDTVNVLISNYQADDSDMVSYEVISQYHPLVSADGHFSVPNVADWKMTTPREMTYSRNEGYDLTISNLPFDTENAQIEIYRIDSTHNLELIDTVTVPVTDGTLSYSSALGTNSVDLLSITGVE